MDALHSLLFYVSAAIALAGALAASLLDGRRQAYALAGFGLGLALLYADLSAGFAGLVALLCYVGVAALLLGAPALDLPERAPNWVWQLAGVLAAVAFAVLAYAALRGRYAASGWYGGTFGAAAVGRLLIGHDALATVAATAALFVATAAFGLGAVRLAVARGARR